jgi:HupH hydrogenase expression protein, C-terminal conserved region
VSDLRDTAYATAILHEIADLLGQLAAEGRGGAIDLRAMPLGPADRSRLEQVLAEGAVKASIDAGGPSEIFETIYPGVWWTRHRNEAGDVVAEYIEVTDCPQFLRSQADDIREGASGLRRLLG